MSNTEYRHYTDTLNSIKTVQWAPCGKQQWIEIQLVDERGEPLGNLPYKVTSEATSRNLDLERTGFTDEYGVIRLTDLYPIEQTLHLTANPLAQVLQQRKLTARRPEFEPQQPMKPLGYPDPPAGFSDIAQDAYDHDYLYKYVRVGQLVDDFPDFKMPESDDAIAVELGRLKQSFHFPDPDFTGLKLSPQHLNNRTVLEVCPFRAWVLLLEHQSSYSLINAYNLGLMAILSYAREDKKLPGSIDEFFAVRCRDLSRTPHVLSDCLTWACMVVDVPFDDRYMDFNLLDTSEVEPPEGDTQLFYAISERHVLVSWRGTEMDQMEDLRSDIRYRPVVPNWLEHCLPVVPCEGIVEKGGVHLGFREGLELAHRKFPDQLNVLIPKSAHDRPLFIAGHSLGGALSLLHAAQLRPQQPLLYTYGMPRAFTLQAVKALDDLPHFRHVNDGDVVPRVPPEAELDNWFYELYGPIGTTLGAAWNTLVQLPLSLLRQKDPFYHHGKLAGFVRVSQHTMVEQHNPAFQQGQLAMPAQEFVSHPLPKRAKLYVVPSLSPASGCEAGEQQEAFRKTPGCVSQDLADHENPKARLPYSAFDHSMIQYQSYLRDHLVEAINPRRGAKLKHAKDREIFRKQLNENRADAATHELRRNELFLELAGQLYETLASAKEEEDTRAALERFERAVRTS